MRSKNSFVSILEQQNDHDDGNDNALTTEETLGSNVSLLTNTLIEDIPTNGNIFDADDTRVNESNTNTAGGVSQFDQFSADVDSEMTLKFDIQRPILGIFFVHLFKVSGLS